MTTTTTESPNTDAGPARFGAPTGVRLRPSGGKIRLPWVLLGVLLVVGSGLVFAAWADGANDRKNVLTLTRDVEAGEIIAASDLTTVGIGSDAAINVIRSDHLEDVLGRTVLVRLERGTLLNEGVLTNGPLVDEGRALVAISLPNDTIPAQLRAGDSVMAVETPGVDGALGPDTDPIPRVWAGEIFSVTTTENIDGTVLSVISLEVDPFSAAEIAAAAAGDRVRLVAVTSAVDIPPDLLLGARADQTAGVDAVPPPAEDLGGRSESAPSVEGDV